MKANSDVQVFEIVNRTIGISPAVVDIMAGDMGSKRMRFCMDRFYDGVDLAQKSIAVNYINAVQVVGKSTQTRLCALEEAHMTFDWVIDGTPIEAPGVVTFDVEFFEVDDQGKLLFSWHTKPAKFVVGTSLAQRGDSTLQEQFLQAAPTAVQTSKLVDMHPCATMAGRTIAMPNIEDAVLSNDARSQLVTFDVPRFYDGTDLSEKIICIKFINALDKGGRSVAVNVELEEERIRFGWLIDGRVTVKHGTVRFALEFLGKDEHGGFFCWQSQAAALKITQGLEVTQSMDEPMPDWNQQWLLEAQNIVENVKLSSEQAQECAQSTTKDAYDASNHATLAHQAKQIAQTSAQVAQEQAVLATQHAQEAARLNTITQQFLLQLPIRHYVKSLAERDALQNVKHGEMCYVCLFEEMKTDIYIWDTGDMDADGTTLEWVFIGRLGFSSLDKQTLLDVLQLPAVAIGGRYADLSGKPPRYQPFGVLDASAASITWDFAQCENAIVTFTGNKAIALQNVTPGAVGILFVNGGTLTLPAQSKKRADFDYVTGSTYEYSFVYDGINYYWQRSAYNG